MANQLFRKAKEKFLQGKIAWETDVIRCCLIDTNIYTLDIYNHEFLSDIPVDARVAISTRMTGNVAEDGVADADDIVFTEVVGSTIEAMVIFKETENELDSPLIMWIDDTYDIPFPVTPTGADIYISWSNTANKIFKI